MMMNVVFFFKQKTAYEMRISDWSSDVRSSDLDGRTENLNGGPDFDNVHQDSIRASLLVEPTDTIKSTTIFDYFRADERAGGLHLYRQQPGVLGAIRSEEHTSELQSLMRISYAVFCLKKKNKNIHNKKQHEQRRTRNQDNK